MPPEETKEEEKSEEKSSTGLTEEQLNKIIKENVSSSMKTVLSEQAAEAQQRQQQYQNQQYNAQQGNKEEDVWDTILDPKINPRFQRAELMTMASEDKADFYSSDAWLTEVDEMLPGETSEEIKKHKAEIRKRLEKTFSNLISRGAQAAAPRSDLIDYEVGKYIKEHKEDFFSSVEKKRGKKKEDELDKAKRAVDIGSGNISNFKPENIHKMSYEKVVEEFGNVAF